MATRRIRDWLRWHRPQPAENGDWLQRPKRSLRRDAAACPHFHGIRPLWAALALAAAVAAAVVVIAPLVGSARIDYMRAFAGLSPDREILFYARLPRVLLAALAGGALGVAGVLFQALLRDALATPYTLGISSGASLGAVLALCLGWRQVLGLPAVSVSAFAGATLVLLVVLAVASEGRRMSSFTLLLAGVTINSICLALILFFQSIASLREAFAVLHWLMGGIDPVEYSTLAWLALATLVPLGYAFLRARQWNLLAVGEEWAAARGVAVGRLMLAGYLAGSLVTGSVTSPPGGETAPMTVTEPWPPPSVVT